MALRIEASARYFYTHLGYFKGQVLSLTFNSYIHISSAILNRAQAWTGLGTEYLDFTDSSSEGKKFVSANYSPLLL
jgi:hypothetical protein